LGGSSLTIDLLDIPRVFILAFLEIFLSADNAAVLAILCSRLPPSLQKRALFIGSLSAFFLRAGALFTLSYLLQYRFIQVLGGLYLIYIALKRPKQGEPQTASFWKTVILIELFDLLFAIDSMVAGIAFINGDRSKLWVVYVGGMIGLFAMRYAATFFLRFPFLQKIAYLLAGLAGLKLLIGNLLWS
jgi:YkoY family integral membrane protein